MRFMTAKHALGLSTLLIVLLMQLQPAMAASTELSFVNGRGMDSDKMLDAWAHFVLFESPEGWKNTFTQSISLYGTRYGDTTGIQGAIAFWAPPKDPDDPESRYTMIGRAGFDLGKVPDSPGWFTVELPVMQLPPVFGVTVYTFSNDNRGYRLGLTERKRDTRSNSFYFGRGQINTDLKPNITREGREWMLRLSLRDTLEPVDGIASGDLTGSSFGLHDDGSVDQYTTVQKEGALVRFSNSKARSVKRVYIFGMAQGDWMSSGQKITVSLLSMDMGILHQVALPYTQYTNTPNWSYVDIPRLDIPRDFFVLVEPNSRPLSQFMLGVDTSSLNQYSGWGVVGAKRDWNCDWNCDAPQDSSNFMVRVEYR
jgi:hypothetical protein